MLRRRPISTLFPYTTLFRSQSADAEQTECSVTENTVGSGEWSLTVRSARTARAGLNHSPLPTRSEEHTSELQSHSDLVCRLLLEKKKKKMHDLMDRQFRWRA